MKKHFVCGARLLFASLLFLPHSLLAQEDPPEITIGERLFLETRFAEFFQSHSHGNVNKPLQSGDPTVGSVLTLGATLPGPFAGESMNCRSCHFVDEFSTVKRAGNRTYSDFARHSPIPARSDGKTFTVRNSPPLVNASLDRNTGFFLHFDGEFTTMPDLVKGTMTGRNFGWLPNEKNIAVAHVATVIRQDNGRGTLASETGGAYSVILKGTDPNIPAEFRLPQKFRIDVTTASDQEILNKVAALVSAYVTSLEFARDENGEFNGSPFDAFLRKNSLPTTPAKGETSTEYSRRLLDLINAVNKPRFVSPADGSFHTHAQSFVFGPKELSGLKIFLGQGNCVACHAAPLFTDFRFHNTGAAQEEYDSIHGDGDFALLPVPSLASRQANPAEFLPATSQHPKYSDAFRNIVSVDHPNHTDLGLWNIFANPDFPKSQAGIKTALCPSGNCTDENTLPRTLAVFKTPGLRDLGHSAPYLHTGQKDTLEDVIAFYIKFSNLTRAKKVRNGAPEVSRIRITSSDINPLAAFLRSLNEDYE